MYETHVSKEDFEKILNQEVDEEQVEKIKKLMKMKSVLE